MLLYYNILRSRGQYFWKCFWEKRIVILEKIKCVFWTENICVFTRKKKKENRYIYISYTALCGNFKPNPLCQGKKKYKRRMIHMRINVNGKKYTLRNEMKDFYLELVCGLIILTVLFSLVSLTVFIANTICPL